MHRRRLRCGVGARVRVFILRGRTSAPRIPATYPARRNAWSSPDLRDGVAALDMADRRPTGGAHLHPDGSRAGRTRHPRVVDLLRSPMVVSAAQTSLMATGCVSHTCCSVPAGFRAESPVNPAPVG